MPKNGRVGFSRPLKIIFLSTLLLSVLSADSLDDVMDGFDDEVSSPIGTAHVSVEASSTSPHSMKSVKNDLMDGFDDEPSSLTKKDANLNKKRMASESLSKRETFSQSLLGLTGRITEQVVYSYSDDLPHNNISSLKSSLFLDYEHKFDNGFKFKTNGKAYYDAIYDVKGEERYSTDELDELQSEVELYDAYVEGSLHNNLDFKVGRQVVVWGRSDTIRVTDVLNPLDNRRPGMIDIEDLRLPVGMAKLDYFVGDWRITPMAIAEQRFSKNPPAGSAFNPRQQSLPNDKDYSEVTPALSVGAEFSGWDVNFYATQKRDDAGYFKDGELEHAKVNMLGSAVNILEGSWLLKSEVAHFDGLKYSSTPNKEFKRTDALVGVEYNGFADTLLSYDVAISNIHDYDNRLKNEITELDERNYQHAFRMSKDFMNATVKANYLISMFGASADKGGFQRAWIKYDHADGVYTNVGVVDYIGGSKRFDAVSNNDMAFIDVTYSF
jgi:hypothetical protein